jgi:hypothetical protein
MCIMYNLKGHWEMYLCRKHMQNGAYAYFDFSVKTNSTLLLLSSLFLKHKIALLTQYLERVTDVLLPDIPLFSDATPLGCL